MAPDVRFGFSRKLIGTVGTTATTFAHGLGTTPDWAIIVGTSATVAGVLRVTARDQTNITVISSVAATPFEAYVGVFND